ncbi:MAG TPA: glutamine-hydrolyzing GMP synthase, partial [Deltaproteobacteria bacterium]|nr:glutamine-hydrolyzing GMP synthase [Deltaproteobacteria bacterium]
MSTLHASRFTLHALMNKVLILDYGSQYTQLIARRIREQHVYSEIQAFNWPYEKIRDFAPQAVILSGGPASVLGKEAPGLDLRLLELGVPILGICYGIQLLAHHLGGKVSPSTKREYGRALFQADPSSPLFRGLKRESSVWMSHGDRLEKIPEGFIKIGESDNTPYCAIAAPERRIYGVQFHPEVVHTEEGVSMLRNFLFDIAGLKPEWSMAAFLQTEKEKIRRQVGAGKVICGLSGGVDSTVAALLIHEAIGDQLECIFIDNGLLRKDEAKKVEETFRGHFKIKLHAVDAAERFLKRLQGVSDPEAKRKAIGQEFICVFEEMAHQIQGAEFLAQGTLYPDV